MEDLVSLMQYEGVRSVVAVLVACRIVFKVIFTILKKYTDMTVEVEDDSKLAKILDSKAYEAVSFILDLAASIKTPKRKK